MADLGNQKGAIQSGIRPVVIMSNPMNNKFAPIVNVLPITSKTKNNIPVHVDIGEECGLFKKSIVLPEQVLTINKTQLKELIGRCPNNIMEDISRAVFLQMYLCENLQLVCS